MNADLVLLAAAIAILVAAPLLDRFFDRPLRKRLSALTFTRRARAETG